MKKNRLFCKLLSVVSVLAVAFLLGLPNNGVGAFSTKEIVEGCLNNSLYLKELSSEQLDFVRSLGFRDYKEFRVMVTHGLGSGFSRKNRGQIDNVRFVYLIKLINSAPSAINKIEFMKMLISMRTKEERRNDRVVAKIIDEKLSVILADLSSKVV